MRAVKMPNLCAQCGKNPPDMFIAMEERLTTTRNIVELSVLNKTKVQVLSYQIPLCNQCRQENKVTQNVSDVVRIIALLIFLASIAVFILNFIDAKALPSLPWLVSFGARFQVKPKDLGVAAFFALMGLAAVVGVVSKMISAPRLVYTNGKTFRFYNKDFQRAFGRLNPNLVKTPVPDDTNLRM